MNDRPAIRSSLARSTTLPGLVALCLANPAAAEQRIGEDRALTGHVEVGVRTVNDWGDRGKYKQHVNLDGGVRLFDFDLTYAPTSADGFRPDLLTLNAAGLGGDPYQNARLDVRKYGKYRVRWERRKSDYFYQDLLVAPQEVDIESSNEGDLHRFDLERVSDRADIDLQLSHRAKLIFGYDRYSREGESTTVLDVQREEFELDSPVDQTFEQLEVGLEYVWNKATLNYRERWRSFEHTLRAATRQPTEGLDPMGPTRLERFLFVQPYDHDSREHQLGLVARPTSRWRLQADALVTELDMDVRSREEALGTDFTNQPFGSELRTTGQAERDSKQLYLSASFAVTDSVRLVAAARDQRLDQDGRGSVGGNVNVGRWEIDSEQLEFGLEALPLESLSLSAGWSQQRRKVTYRSVAATGSGSTRESTDNDGLWMQVSYRPSEQMEWRASVEDNSIDDPFTRASASDVRRYRLQGKYRWDNGLVLSATHTRREHDNALSDWQADSRHSVLRVARTNHPLELSFEYHWLDLGRSVNQLVTGGLRQDLFLIDYRADTRFWNADIAWAASDLWTLWASHREYRNRGSFQTDRDDSRVGVSLALSRQYQLHLRYRRSGFEEPPAEQFEANIFELALGYRL